MWELPNSAPLSFEAQVPLSIKKVQTQYPKRRCNEAELHAHLCRCDPVPKHPKTRNSLVNICAAWVCFPGLVNDMRLAIVVLIPSDGLPGTLHESAFAPVLVSMEIICSVFRALGPRAKPSEALRSHHVRRRWRGITLILTSLALFSQTLMRCCLAFVFPKSVDLRTALVGIQATAEPRNG